MALPSMNWGSLEITLTVPLRTINFASFRLIYIVYRVRQKNVISSVSCKIVPFLCNSAVWYFFNIFWKLFIFFGTTMLKNHTTIFSQNQSSEKQNCEYTLFLSNSMFNKDWITESQKICKIVIRKFPIFSSGLISKEKFFKSSSSFLLSIF